MGNGEWGMGIVGASRYDNLTLVTNHPNRLALFIGNGEWGIGRIIVIFTLTSHL